MERQLVKRTFRFRTAANPRQRLRGAVVLETLLAVPVLLVAVMGIVELSMVTAGLSHVQRAARDGADIASALGVLPLAGRVPAEIEEAVSVVLREHRADWTQIRLDHNDGPAPPYVLK